MRPAFLLRKNLRSARLSRRLFFAAGALPCFVSTNVARSQNRRPAQRSKVQLTLAGLSYGVARRLGPQGLDDFTSRTGISVHALPAWGNSTDQFAVTRNTLQKHFATPDIYVIDVIWPGSLAPDLLDLNPYVTGQDRRHIPALLANDTIDGRLVGLPFYLNIGMLYYRPDLLEKYKFHHPPRTWAELETMAAAIQRGERKAGRSTFWGYVWQGSAYEGLTCNALEWQVSFGGGRVVETDGTVSVNNPRAAAALEMAARWVGSISPPSVLSYNESDSLNAFRTGDAAFLRYWSSGYSPVNQQDSPVRDRFKVTLLPSGPKGRAQTMGGFQVAASRYSAHGSEAAELARFLTSAEVQKCRAVEDGYLPTLPRLYDDPELMKAVPQAEALREAGLTDWVARPSSVARNAYANLSRTYFTAVHAVLSRQIPAEEALHNVEKRAIELMRASRK
jgi:trehalose/maltose transport system substrate-binding protein